MSTYSIRDIEQLSGIKAHTIRIWEQRYNFIKPKRTDTNIRYYDDEDLKLILNISLLKDNGHKISKISKMPIEDLKSEVQKITEQKLGYSDQIHALTLAMVDLDEKHFDKLISTNILQIGLERTITKIIAPFFNRIGILWQTGAINPAHEHFISNLIRQKLIVAIDGQITSLDENSKKFLLFLPEGELHEISLLISSYILQSRNHQVVYLGQSLPFPDLEIVYNIHRPDYLLSVFTSYPPHNGIQGFIYKLSDRFKGSTVLLSGLQLVGNSFDFPENVLLFSKIEDMISFTDSIS